MYDPMTFVLVPEGEKNRLPWPGTSSSIPVFPREIHPSIRKIRSGLALKGRSDVDDVDFATVWNKKHTLAERTGSSIDNFIAWVKKSTEAEDQKK